MDLPPPAQEPGAARFPSRPFGAADPGASARADPAPSGELEWRLSQLEAGLRHIDRRIQQLEETVSRSVAEQAQAVAGDLRRSVSELGRRLVLELPQVLARHRDEIIAELRPAAPEPHAEPATAPPAAPGALDEAPAETPDDEPDPPVIEAADEVPAAPSPPAKRRRLVHGLRQRDS